MDQKTCTKCGTVFVTVNCPPCAKERNALYKARHEHEEVSEEKREKARKYKAEYYQKNKDRLGEQARAYSKKNKEEITAKKAAWHKEKMLDPVYAEKHRERHRGYWESNKNDPAHKEMRSASFRRFYEENKEGLQARGRAYHAANKEKSNEYSRQYAASDPERQYLRKRRYRQENQDKCNASSGRYRAARLQSVPGWVDEFAVSEIYRTASLMGLEVDHIVPLRSPLVCGLHWEGNMQVIPRLENLRKNNYRWPDMPNKEV